MGCQPALVFKWGATTHARLYWLVPQWPLLVSGEWPMTVQLYTRLHARAIELSSFLVCGESIARLSPAFWCSYSLFLRLVVKALRD